MNDFEQLIKSPAKICDQSRSVIDLVFVNNNHRVVESDVIPSVISEHFIVYCTVKSAVPKVPPKTMEYRSYRAFEKNSFIRDLKAVDWNILDEADDLNSAVEVWNLLFSDIANKHARYVLKELKHLGLQQN